jgi:hypothetical protein
VRACARARPTDSLRVQLNALQLQRASTIACYVCDPGIPELPGARLGDVQADGASAFGWNEGCVEGRNACGKRDLPVRGRAVDASGDELGARGGPSATLVPVRRLFGGRGGVVGGTHR